LHVYIDGSGRHHSRRGGFAIRFVYLDSDIEKSEDFPCPSFPGASNNQMELKACVQAFKEILEYPNIRRFRRITIFSDSDYVVNNQGNAIYWYKSKYRKSRGGLVENADIWKEWLKEKVKLSKLLRGVFIELVWKKRRSNEHMRAVDNMAKTASLTCNTKRAPFRAVGVRRHRIPLRLGNVNFFGQRMTIYVVTAEPMKVQKMNKYCCQVISRGSIYYGRKDIIHTPDQLREGHRYNVTCTERENDPGTCNIQIHRKYKTKKEAKEAES